MIFKSVCINLKHAKNELIFVLLLSLIGKNVSFVSGKSEYSLHRDGVDDYLWLNIPTKKTYQLQKDYCCFADNNFVEIYDSISIFDIVSCINGKIEIDWFSIYNKEI